MINPRTQYKVMRGSGLTPVGAACFVALMVVTAPFFALATWATPKERGFGNFRARERIVDIADLEESTRTTDRSDHRFFTQANGTPADAWWHEEIRMLRMLDNQAYYKAACDRLRRAETERNQTRLVTICVGVMLAAFAVALYAMRYLS